jgi:cell division protein ZapA
MADSQQTKSIRVQIMGREYALRVQEDDEAHTRRVASSVNRRMKQFNEAHPEQAELTTAVMTALTLAEELYLQREQHEDGTAALTKELDQLSQRLEEAVPASAVPEEDGEDE